MKKAVSARIDENLLERAKNAIFHVGRNLSLNGLLEEGLEYFVRQLEKNFNDSQQFPSRANESKFRPKKIK